MSETVHYKGKLAKVEILQNETIEDTCKRICEKEGITELPEYTSDFRECIFDTLYDKYIEIDGELYKFIENKEIGDFDIFDMHQNNDGTFDFDVMFYNGGCSLSEALETAKHRM